MPARQVHVLKVVLPLHVRVFRVVGTAVAATRHVVQLDPLRMVRRQTPPRTAIIIFPPGTGAVTTETLVGALLGNRGG